LGQTLVLLAQVLETRKCRCLVITKCRSSPVRG
jgi:hypothetical protein